MRYKTEVKEWEPVEMGITYKIQCCDCGLVHDYKYKKEKGKIFVSTKRNERSTAQIRRHLKK